MREKERSTRIIFVRHGQTDFPLDRIYCDQVEDPPLNSDGRMQAQAAADLLAGWVIDHVYASPALRTRLTAEAVALPHRLPVTLLESLRERHFGIWEGLCFNEIESRYPLEYRAWKTDQAGFSPEGGESVYDMLSRVRQAIRGLIAAHSGQTLLVVTHVGPIRLLVADAIGLPVEAYRCLRIDPASATCVDYGRTQNNLIFTNFHPRHGA